MEEERDDDGPGLPENVAPGPSSGFGMGLPDLPVRQIGGSLHIEREEGSRSASIERFRQTSSGAT